MENYSVKTNIRSLFWNRSVLVLMGTSFQNLPTSSQIMEGLASVTHSAKANKLNRWLELQIGWNICLYSFLRTPNSLFHQQTRTSRDVGMLRHIIIDWFCDTAGNSATGTILYLIVYVVLYQRWRVLGYVTLEVPSSSSLYSLRLLQPTASLFHPLSFLSQFMEHFVR